MVTKVFTGYSGSISAQASAKKPSKQLLKKIRSLEQTIKASKSCSIEEAKAIQGRIALLKTACSPHKKTWIRWANLNNRINQRINNLQLAVITPASSEKITSEHANEKSSFPSWLSYAGIALGTFTGLFFREIPLTEKSRSLQPVLKSINHYKQTEIKSIALALPFLIYICQVGIEMSKDAETKAIFSRFLKAAKKPISMPLVASLITTFASMIIAGQAKHWLEGFDPSGHMMLKIQLASLTNQLLSEGPKVSSYRLLLAAYTVYVLTDAILLHNTTNYFHTGNEILAGIGIGAGLSRIAALVSLIYRREPKEVPQSM